MKRSKHLVKQTSRNYKKVQISSVSKNKNNQIMTKKKKKKKNNQIENINHTPNIVPNNQSS